MLEHAAIIIDAIDLDCGARRSGPFFHAVTMTVFSSLGRRARRSLGFTLIEMMVVLVIIVSILLGILSINDLAV